jgi:molybdopterin synthase catalytic subunit
MDNDIKLIDTPIDFHASQLMLREKLRVLPECGGLTSFEGIVRNHNQGLQVKSLEYSAYSQLALAEMSEIAREASLAHDLNYVQIIHRIGKLFIGETAVLIHVITGHRSEAFAGCRMIIDQIKMRVPIWKKEHYIQGHSDWVLCSHHQFHREASMS